MPNDNPQTERETVESELKNLDDNTYDKVIMSLSREELEAECLKQFTLSGEMLDKYRLYWQKSEDYRKQRDQAWRDLARWRNLTVQCRNVLHEAVERFGAIQHIEQESGDYTQNAKVVVRRLVHGIAQNMTDKLKAVLVSIQKEIDALPQESFDLPF